MGIYQNINWIKMSHMYAIPEARALYASLFLHYLIYGFLWLVEGCKFDELNAGNKEAMAGHGSTEL